MLWASRWKTEVDLTGQLYACSAISRPEKQKLTSARWRGVECYHATHILFSELWPGAAWALLSLFTSWVRPQSLGPDISILDIRVASSRILNRVWYFCFEIRYLIVTSCVKLRWWVIYPSVFLPVPGRNSSPVREHTLKRLNCKHVSWYYLVSHINQIQIHRK